MMVTISMKCTAYCFLNVHYRVLLCLGYFLYSVFCTIFVNYAFAIVFTMHLQIASFSGWECVECNTGTNSSTKLCGDCDAANRTIAGALR